MTNNVERQAMGNDRQLRMTYNGNDRQWAMTMRNDRQQGMADNKKWPTIENDR